MKWNLIKKKLSELEPYKFNPRRITEKGLKDLDASISKFGLAEPIVINTNNIIIGGHARYFVLKQKKVKECDCYIPDRELTDKEMQELNIRLNRNIASEWDFDILANSFELPELIEWGFESKEFVLVDNNINIELQKVYEVVIDCDNEKNQEDIFNKINAMGLKCRLLTL